MMNSALTDDDIRNAHRTGIITQRDDGTYCDLCETRPKSVWCISTGEEHADICTACLPADVAVLMALQREGAP